MTNQEKFDYVMAQLDAFIVANTKTPFTEEEKNAFYYRMLLLGGPVESVEAIVKGKYKTMFKVWLMSIVPPFGLQIADKVLLVQLKKL